MSTIYHTPIDYNAIADDDTFNDPLGQLDLALDDANTFITAHTAEISAARGGYASLDARLDALIPIGGNIATQANGAAAAGQKDVTVDSTVGFVATAYVAYTLAGGTVEYNTIASITPTTLLTLGTNIGTGGIADNTYIAMISPSEYQAANAIPHGSTDLTLPESIQYTNSGVFNAQAYGMSTAGAAADNAAALQAAIEAASTAGGGKVVIAPGTYALTAVILKSGVSLEGGGFGQDPADATKLGTVLTISGANYGIQMGGKAADGFMMVRNLTIVGTSSGKAGIRLGYHQASASHYVTNATIENVWVGGFTSSSVAHDVSTGEPAAAGGAGVYIARGITCTLRNVHASGCYHGIFENSDHNSTTLIFDGCSSRVNTKHGILLRDFTHYTLRDCVFEANGDSGLALIAPSGGSVSSGLTLNQCYFEANGASAGSGSQLYQMYIDGTEASHLRLRMDACSFQPGDTGAVNGVYLKKVLHGFLTYCSIGGGSGYSVTTDTCEAILFIDGDPASSTARGRPNSLDASPTDTAELLMSDHTLTFASGAFRVDTDDYPLVLRQVGATNEHTHMQVLRNTSANVMTLAGDAGGGDAELTLFTGGLPSVYLKSGSGDESTFFARVRMPSLGVGNSAAATTLGSVTKKVQIYDANGDSIGYIPVYDSIT